MAHCTSAITPNEKDADDMNRLPLRLGLEALEKAYAERPTTSKHAVLFTQACGSDLCDRKARKADVVVLLL